jgi:hypothetical protein
LRYALQSGMTFWLYVYVNVKKTYWLAGYAAVQHFAGGGLSSCQSCHATKAHGETVDADVKRGD